MIVAIWVLRMARKYVPVQNRADLAPPAIAPELFVAPHREPASLFVVLRGMSVATNNRYLFAKRPRKLDRKTMAALIRKNAEDLVMVLRRFIEIFNSPPSAHHSIVGLHHHLAQKGKDHLRFGS